MQAGLARQHKPDEQKQHNQQADAQAGDAGDAAEAARGIQELAHGRVVLRGFLNADSGKQFTREDSASDRTTLLPYWLPR